VLYRAAACGQMNAYEFTACITAIGPKYDDDDKNTGARMRGESQSRTWQGVYCEKCLQTVTIRVRNSRGIRACGRQKDRPMQSGDNAPS